MHQPQDGERACEAERERGFLKDTLGKAERNGDATLPK